MKRTQGSETSQYLEEEKSKEIPSVAASEGGRAQTDPNTEPLAGKAASLTADKRKKLIGIKLVSLLA